ncbi:baseplate hub protein [Castellaniella sp. UC4442_H9]
MATGINQYLRRWSMLVNGKPFIDATDGRQFRVVFDIDIEPGGSYSRADIRLFNLAESTKISTHDDIILNAGYQSSFGAIFTGSVANVFLERNGPDLVTRLTCSTANARTRGVVSIPFGAGARLTDVLKAVTKEWPLRLQIDESQFTAKDSFPTGWTAHGDPVQILEDLARMFDFAWVVDQGDLVVTRPDRERTTGVVDVNEFTGMVGMPTINRGPSGLGVFVTARVNPFIRINSRINLTAKYATYSDQSAYLQEFTGKANGIFNVLRLMYRGDSFGDDWDVQIEGLRAGTAEPPASEGGGLVWGARVPQDFRTKVREIAKNLNLNPDWLMAVMAFETGKDFKAYTRNKVSGATGLIQFIPSTARGMGTSTAQLAGMSEVEQLDWVEKYFKPYAPNIHNMSDCYMAVLWPAAIGKSDDYVLWTQGSIEYTQNAGLDINHDGTVTKAEAASRVNRAYMEGQAHKR